MSPVGSSALDVMPSPVRLLVGAALTMAAAAATIAGRNAWGTPGGTVAIVLGGMWLAAGTVAMLRTGWQEWLERDPDLPCVYDLRDSCGRALYVGSRVDYGRRLAEHRRAGEPWRRDIDPEQSGVVSRHLTVIGARMAERSRIKLYATLAALDLVEPIHNTVGNRPHRTPLGVWPVAVWLTAELWLASPPLPTLRVELAPGQRPLRSLEPDRVLPSRTATRIVSQWDTDAIEAAAVGGTLGHRPCVDCGTTDDVVRSGPRCVPCGRARDAARKREQRRR